MSALTRGAVTSTNSQNPNPTAGTGSQSIGAAAVTILGQNNLRQFLLVQNASSAGTIAFTMDGTTPVVNGPGSITFTSGQALIMDTFVPTGPIIAIASGASTALTVYEG